MKKEFVSNTLLLLLSFGLFTLYLQSCLTYESSSMGFSYQRYESAKKDIFFAAQISDSLGCQVVMIDPSKLSKTPNAVILGNLCSVPADRDTSILITSKKIAAFFPQYFQTKPELNYCITKKSSGPNLEFNSADSLKLGFQTIGEIVTIIGCGRSDAAGIVMYTVKDKLNYEQREDYWYITVSHKLTMQNLNELRGSRVHASDGKIIGVFYHPIEVETERRMVLALFRDK